MLRRNLGLAIPLMLLSTAAFAQTVPGSVREGNEHFSKGRYEHALKKYQAAQVESPADERIGFNLGAAQYKLGDYNDALSEFQLSAQSADSKLQAQSHYNAGNTLYRMGRLEDAVEQYLRTLEIDPNDEDAKFNLEFVRREIERRQKEQQQRQQEQQNKKQEKDEKQQQGNSQANQQQQQQQKQESASSDKRNGDGRQEKEQQTGQKPTESPENGTPGQQLPDETKPDTEQNAGGQTPQTPQEGKMSRDNVERWLDMIEAESEDNMKDFLRQQTPREPAGYAQDW